MLGGSAAIAVLRYIISLGGTVLLFSLMSEPGRGARRRHGPFYTFQRPDILLRYRLKLFHGNFDAVGHIRKVLGSAAKFFIIRNDLFL